MKCAYYKCETRPTHSPKRPTDPEKPHFRFPVKNPVLLKQWIENSGNDNLKYMSLDKLRNQGLCSDHFENKYLRTAALRATLFKTAVPIPFSKSSNDNLKSMGLDKLSNQQLCSDHFEKKNLRTTALRTTPFKNVAPIPFSTSSLCKFGKWEFNPNKVQNTYIKKKRKIEIELPPLSDVKIEPFDENECIEIYQSTSRTDDIQINVKSENISDQSIKDVETNTPKIKPMESTNDKPQIYVKIEPISEDVPENFEPNTANGRLSYVKIEPNSETSNGLELETSDYGNQNMEPTTKRTLTYVEIELEPTSEDGNQNMKPNTANETLSYVKIEPNSEDDE